MAHDVLLKGSRLGHYEIDEHIGAGGMGDVYRARDTRLNRFVALKTSNAEYSDRFEREMRAIAALSHPNVCALYDVGASPEVPAYLVMELLEGETLSAVLAGRRVTTQEALRITAQIADALEAAHAKGIVHRDIKPGNVFLSPKGHVKVLDFGLAKLTSSIVDEAATRGTDLSQTGQTMGTVAYMSPEQARGEEIDARSDLWSLGVVLYEMLTGSRPFEGSTQAVVFNAILEKTPSAPGVGPEIDRVVTMLLEKDRALRCQSAADLLADLKRLERDTDSASVSVTGEAAPAHASRTRSWWLAAAAGVMLAIGAGVWFSRPPAPGTQPAPANNDKPAEAVHEGSSPELDLARLQITKEDRLVVADFVNKTGEQVFDDTLHEALLIKLEQSNLVRPMSDGQVQTLLASMRKKADAKLTPALAAQVCLRAAQKAMLSGSITALGTSYVLQLNATDCTNGEVLAAGQAQAGSKERVLDALSQAVDAMREKLGEQLISAQRTGGHESLPLTTASLEAFKSYVTGLEAFRQGKRAESNAYFKRAREIDPAFAWAWTIEAITAPDAGRAQEQVELMTKAYEHRQSASEVERLTVEAYYARYAERDPEKERQLFEKVLELAPHTGAAQNDLANVYASMGNFKRAAELHEQLLVDHPDFVLSYTNLARDYYFLDRFREARRVLEKAVAQKLESPNVHALLLRIAYLERDMAAVEKEEAAWISVDANANVENARANYALATGRFREFSEVRARQGRGGRGVGQSFVDPIALAFAENCDATNTLRVPDLARGAAPAALIQAPIAALLICGQRESLLSAAESGLENPNLDREVALRMRATAGLAEGQPAQAIAELREKVRVDTPGTEDLLLISLAYMDLDRPADAARELRKVTSRKSRLFDQYYPRAHVDLARALVAAGDKAGAKQAYETFFKLWEKADEDIPLLVNAKKEHAELK